MKICTKIFESSGYVCLKDLLQEVNEFINQSNILKEDIIEYRTDSWTSREDTYLTLHHFKVTMSYIQKE